MAVSIKSVTNGIATPGQASVVTSESPTATAVGDIIVVTNHNNFYAATNMVAPTATGSPTMVAITGTGLPADGGTNLAHIKGWWYQANTAGAQTISETETGTADEEKALVAYVLAGADTSNPIEVAAGATGSSASFTAPSVSPTSSDAFLIVVASDGGGAAGGPFTTPGTYTEDKDFTVGANNLSVVAAHKQLSASGATGTIAFSAFTTAPWAAMTIAIKTAGAAGPPALPWTKFAPGAALKRKIAVRQTGPLQGGAKVAAPPLTWFTDLADGVTPSLLVSAEDWAILCNGGLNHAGDFAATYEDYFTSRQAQGYNSILVSLFSGTFFSGGANGPDSDGTYPFNTNSTDPLNPANTTFWGRRDTFLTKAAAHGFRVMLNASTPFVHAGSFTASWTNTQWAALGTFLGNRYASQPNILWMMGDDYFDDIDPGFDAFYNALRAAGATQPISIQNWQETTSRKDIYNGTSRPWGAGHAQYNFGYSYNVWYDVVEKMGLEANPLPYFAGDGTFLNTGGLSGITDVQLMRRQVWWALSSGSKGFQVGDNDIWTWDSTALGFVTSKSFYTAVVPAIASRFRSLPKWHLLTADTSNLLVTAGRGTHASPLVSGGSGGQYLADTDSYVTASFIQSGVDAGKLAVIYMSHGSTITIDQSKMVGGYSATWVDPKTGALSAATPGTTYNSTAKGNNSDGQADWVLVLSESPLSGGTTPVSTTRSTTWNVKAQVAATRVATWDVLAPVSTTRATTWDVLSQLSATRATTWRVLSKTTATKATTWNVKAQVAATRAATWDVLGQVAATRATTWDVLAGVTATRATTWRVLAGVTASRATTWRVLAKITATRATTWDVLAQVAASRVATWDTLAQVAATRATTWNVASTLTQVSTTRVASWRVLAQVSATRVATYDVLAKVTATKVASWDVLGQVAVTRATTWDVLGQVAATRATTWRVLAKITATRVTTWNVASALIQVSTTRATTWRVLAKVTATGVASWDVRTVASTTKVASWDVLARVTPATRSTTWRVLASVTATRSTTWNVKVKVTATRGVLWDTRATVAIARVTSWNVFFGLSTLPSFRIVSATVWWPETAAVLEPVARIVEATAMVPVVSAATVEGVVT